MEEKKTVLIVEDEKGIVDILRFNLEKEGYAVLTAYDGETGLALAQEKNPDIILLDVMLPKMNGFDVCRILREKGSSVPVIILTAREEESDKVLGLELGADDYITKPFSMRELMARVKANIRRTAMQAGTAAPAAIPAGGGLTIDTGSMQVWRGEEEVSLTRTEYELLLLFARNPRRAMYRETIYERVWGEEYPFGSKAVDLHVQRLRKKVGWEHMLQAVNKVGYRLEVGP